MRGKIYDTCVIGIIVAVRIEVFNGKEPRSLSRARLAGIEITITGISSAAYIFHEKGELALAIIETRSP